jgi:hypothetical protein
LWGYGLREIKYFRGPALLRHDTALRNRVVTVGVELNVFGSLVIALLEVEVLGLVGETELVEKGSDLPAVRLCATFFERSGLLRGRDRKRILTPPACE